MNDYPIQQSVQHRCRNMHQHMAGEAGRVFASEVLAIPCEDCYSVVIVEVRLPGYVTPEPWRTYTETAPEKAVCVHGRALDKRCWRCTVAQQLPIGGAQ